jgi:hypothetical protein
MMASQEAHCHYFIFFSGAKNNDELPDLSSFLGFFSSNAKDDNELVGSLLVVISWVFSQV